MKLFGTLGILDRKLHPQNSILVSLTFAIMLILNGCNQEKKGIKPEYRSLTEAVYSTVTIVPEELYQVYSETSGIITERYVDEGDTVIKNTPLFLLKQDAVQYDKENARLAYQQAKEQLEGQADLLYEMSKQIETARSKLDIDSIQYFKQLSLWERNIGSKANLDAKYLAYQSARNEWNRLTNLYKRTQSELEKNKMVAKNTYKKIMIRANDYTIKSQLDGIVYSVLKSVGELVSPQSPMAEIGSSEDFKLVLIVDEKDISKVRLGQTIVVSLDAYPNTVFNASLSKILPAMDERSQTFTVEGHFIDRPEKLYKGLSGEANIIISQQYKVLTIPRTYLNSNNEVRTDNGKIQIETGLSNLEYIQVLSGIDTTTIIYKEEQGGS